MTTALEAMPEELFEQVLCLIVVVGIIAYLLIKAFRGDEL